MRFEGSHTTTITPLPYVLDNFGPNIVAVTFKYGSEVFTINRRGKRNIKGYTSNKGTAYTLTNGTDKWEQMSRSQFGFVSVVYADGTVESNGFVA